MLNIDFFCYFVNPFSSLHHFILRIYIFYLLFCNICNIGDSDPKCQCTCDPNCTGEFICLCLCNETEKEVVNGFCISVCNKTKKEKNSECKCLCICICKSGESCCCGSDKSHKCTVSLKIEVGSLKYQSSKIIEYLILVGSSMSKIKEKCCPCSCCLIVTCNKSCCAECQSLKRDYRSVISKIHWIEYLFDQISEEIPELIKLKNILSLISLIAIPCKTCPEVCKEKIKDLIENIRKAIRYYYVFSSRINHIRPFVEYKINYSKSKQISCGFEKSIRCLFLINTKIIKEVFNTNYSISSNRLLIGVYSQYSIWECNVSTYILLQYLSKIYKILDIIGWADGCGCLQKVKSIINNSIDIYNWNKYFSDWGNKKINELEKLYIPGDSNHICMCLVIKLILYPSLIKSMYCLRHYYVETSIKQTKEFLRDNYISTNTNYIIKLIYLIIILLEKNTVYLTKKFIGYKVCYCLDITNAYYQYLISIILYLSSLIENIWATDNRAIVTAIESLSNLYSELKSYDFNSINDKRKVSCNKVCGLIVNKKCPGKKDQKCCCWCVACYNLLVACVSLCVQFNFYKTIIKKDDNKLCNKIKEFCKELECTCPSAKNGCCLLKIASSSQVCNSGTEDICKKLADSCGDCEQKGSCCQKISDMLKSGGDLLLIACECDWSTGTTENIKTWCVLFNNLWGGRSAAVVIFCKCEKEKCCCLKEVIEKLNGELLKTLCEKCQCKELTESLEKICTPGSCGEQCLCKTLTEELKKICGKNSQCLCQEIDKLKTLCSQPACECKKEGCCRCVCCKVLKGAVKVLTRACRQNFLEPYKRITIELLSGTQDNHIKRMIVDSINYVRQKQTFLVKNNYSTHFNTYSHHKNIANRFPSLTVGYAYDSVYEHQEASNSSYTGMNSIRKADPNIRNRRIKIRNKL